MFWLSCHGISRGKRVMDSLGFLVAGLCGFPWPCINLQFKAGKMGEDLAVGSQSISRMYNSKWLDGNKSNGERRIPLCHCRTTAVMVSDSSLSHSCSIGTCISNIYFPKSCLIKYLFQAVNKCWEGCRVGAFWLGGDFPINAKYGK